MMVQGGCEIIVYTKATRPMSGSLISRRYLTASLRHQTEVGLRGAKAKEDGEDEAMGRERMRRGEEEENEEETDEERECLSLRRGNEIKEEDLT